ncbi:MAG TPA: ATP-binding protein [Cyclobacteriaceae bacterium]
MNLKILMLEDLEEDAEMIARALSKSNISFTSTRVDTRADFIDKIKTFKPDMILSDHSLPQFNSIDALNICREMGLSIPFILVTGAMSDEFAVNCLKLGADDYLLKSNLSRLPTSINNVLKQRQLQAQRKVDEETLYSQNKELVKINEELDNFMYSVSHSLRQPLASVMGLINVARIEMEQSPASVSKFLTMMESSVLKLDNTLKDILDYSRNGRVNVSVEKISLRKVIDESFERLKYLKGFDLIEKQIEIIDDVEFYCDRYRLSVIFTNMLSNSIRYCDLNKEKKIINIRATVTPDETIIFIYDNGIGIHPDYISRIFNMFYRATVQSDGAGIGLFIVKETLEKLKGKITVESTPDEGTLFIVTIPNGIPQQTETAKALVVVQH